MTDFEDYDDDEPCEGCAVCGDPLCPGCGQSVQTQMFKIALIPVGVVVLALIFRFMFFGGDNAGNKQASSSKQEITNIEVDAGTSISTTTTSSSTTTSLAAIPIPVGGGSLDEDTIKSVVQVVQVNALGPCSWGSGTVVKDELTVLTNFHVIQTSSDCPSSHLEIRTVSALDDRPSPTHSAVVMATDKVADLAILRLTPNSSGAATLRPVPIRTSSVAGEEIFIIGFPNIGGSSITISKGIVSGFTKASGISWIKTDASVSGGNSGGAAVNGKGELVGVPTMASAGEDGEIVDCRPVADTNRDGAINKYDDCVPIGGFLNLLSPVDRASALLESTDITRSSDPAVFIPPNNQAQRMLDAVNKERVKQDVAPLTWCRNLAAASTTHAKDMAKRGYYEHDTPEGRDPTDRAMTSGYGGGVGENIAALQESVVEVMDAWMHSTGHRENILDPSYIHFGFGIARGQYGGRTGYYWVQNFGGDGIC